VISWFRSKFEIFRTSPLVRNVVGQASSTVSFSDVLAEQRIVLINLSKGMLGQYNSQLIGYIALARLWAAALERASIPKSDRLPFHIYIDEFQNMTNESLPDMLSEARKFGVSLTLANQFFTQIREDTRDAIMGNVGTRLTFRLGPLDAEQFAPWLGGDLHPQDLTRLPSYTAIGSLSESGVPLSPFVFRSDPPSEVPDEKRAGQARKASRRQWASPVRALDDAFFKRWSDVPNSISAQVAADPRPEPEQPKSRPVKRDGTGSNFLDEWLQKRRTEKPEAAEAQDNPVEADQNETVPEEPV
jgi:hypothetical protein